MSNLTLDLASMNFTIDFPESSTGRLFLSGGGGNDVPPDEGHFGGRTVIQILPHQTFNLTYAIETLSPYFFAIKRFAAALLTWSQSVKKESLPTFNRIIDPVQIALEGIKSSLATSAISAQNQTVFVFPASNGSASAGAAEESHAASAVPAQNQTIHLVPASNESASAGATEDNCETSETSDWGLTVQPEPPSLVQLEQPSLVQPEQPSLETLFQGLSRNDADDVHSRFQQWATTQGITVLTFTEQIAQFFIEAAKKDPKLILSLSETLFPGNDNAIIQMYQAAIRSGNSIVDVIEGVRGAGLNLERFKKHIIELSRLVDAQGLARVEEAKRILIFPLMLIKYPHELEQLKQLCRKLILENEENILKVLFAIKEFFTGNKESLYDYLYRAQNLKRKVRDNACRETKVTSLYLDLFPTVGDRLFNSDCVILVKNNFGNLDPVLKYIASTTLDLEAKQKLITDIALQIAQKGGVENYQQFMEILGRYKDAFFRNERDRTKFIETFQTEYWAYVMELGNQFIKS